MTSAQLLEMLVAPAFGVYKALEMELQSRQLRAGSLNGKIHGAGLGGCKFCSGHTMLMQEILSSTETLLWHGSQMFTVYSAPCLVRDLVLARHEEEDGTTSDFQGFDLTGFVRLPPSEMQVQATVLKQGSRFSLQCCADGVIRSSP